MAQFKGVRLALCPTGSLGETADQMESRIRHGPNGKRYNEVFIPPNFKGGIDVILEFPAQPGISAREFFDVPVEEPFEELTIVQQHSSSPIGSLGKETTIKLPVKPFQPIYRFLCLEDVKNRSNFFNFRVFARDMGKAYVTLKFKWATDPNSDEPEIPTGPEAFARRGGYQGRGGFTHRGGYGGFHPYEERDYRDPGFSRGGYTRGGYGAEGYGGYQGGFRGRGGYRGGYGGGHHGEYEGYGHQPGFGGGYEERDFSSGRGDYGGFRGGYRGRGGTPYVSYNPSAPRGRPPTEAYTPATDSRARTAPGDSPQRGASPDTTSVLKRIARENEELKARLERIEHRSNSHPSERADRDRSPIRRHSPDERRRGSPSNA